MNYFKKSKSWILTIRKFFFLFNLLSTWDVRSLNSVIIIPWFVPDHYAVHSAVCQLHLNKTGRKRMEEGGNVANQQWPWAHHQQAGPAGSELTEGLGGPKTPELHPPGFRHWARFRPPPEQGAWWGPMSPAAMLVVIWRPWAGWSTLLCDSWVRPEDSMTSAQLLCCPRPPRGAGQGWGARQLCQIGGGKATAGPVIQERPRCCLLAGDGGATIPWGSKGSLLLKNSLECAHRCFWELSLAGVWRGYPGLPASPPPAHRHLLIQETEEDGEAMATALNTCLWIHISTQSITIESGMKRQRRGLSGITQYSIYDWTLVITLQNYVWPHKS